METHLNETLKREEGIAMASKVFQDTSGEYDWMLELSEEKYQLDMQSKLVHAKREGRKQIIDLLKKGKTLEEIEYMCRLTLWNKLVHARRAGRQEVIDLLKSGKSPEEIIKEYGGN